MASDVQKAKPAPDRQPRPWLFLAVALVTAWFPICRPYLRVADDFHFADLLLTGGVPLYFHEYGVWRILGHELGNAAPLVSPFLPGLMALATHLAGSLLFLAMLRKLLVSESLAMLLAILFAVYPWGDTDLMWACGYTYLLGTTLYIAVLWILTRAYPLPVSRAVPLCALCAALSLFAHEALFFALLISGGLVFVLKEWLPVKQRVALAISPVIGCGIWVVLYKIFPGNMPAEHLKLNPRTLLSGIYYQYTNWEVFEPWRSSATRNLLFFDWSTWQFAIALALLCFLGFIAHRSLNPARQEPGQRAASNRMLVFLIALLVASIAIYAIGGGFSLDSRKKYPVIPALLMCAGYGIQYFAPKLRIHRAAILAAAIGGIATTWLQAGLWRYEVKRLDLLVDILAAQPNPEKVRVEWDSRIQAAWPRANRHWGAPVEAWVLTDAVHLKHLQSPSTQIAPPITALKFDPKRFAWETAN